MLLYRDYFCLQMEWLLQFVPLTTEEQRSSLALQGRATWDSTLALGFGIQ